MTMYSRAKSVDENGSFYWPMKWFDCNNFAVNQRRQDEKHFNGTFLEMLMYPVGVRRTSLGRTHGAIEWEAENVYVITK